jgi:hypothetical protein
MRVRSAFHQATWWKRQRYLAEIPGCTHPGSGVHAGGKRIPVAERRKALHDLEQFGVTLSGQETARLRQPTELAEAGEENPRRPVSRVLSETAKCPEQV